MKTNEINNLVLAYLGDAIYEVYIREHLINQGLANVNDLQTTSLNYVSATSQARILNQLLEKNFLTEAEITIVKRARNTKVNHSPKSSSISQYKQATGLEALIGVLYLNKDTNRINQIMEEILK